MTGCVHGGLPARHPRDGGSSWRRRRRRRPRQPCPRPLLRRRLHRWSSCRWSRDRRPTVLPHRAGQPHRPPVPTTTIAVPTVTRAPAAADVRGVAVSVIVDRPPTPWATVDGVAMGSRGERWSADGPPGLAGWIADRAGAARAERGHGSTRRASCVAPEVAAAMSDRSTISRTAGRCDRVRPGARPRSPTGCFDPTVGSCLRRSATTARSRRSSLTSPDAVRPVPASRRRQHHLRPRPARRCGCARAPSSTSAVIGKGLAADIVVAGALDRGATSACVGVGGDVRVGGVAPDGGWRVPLDDPTGGPAPGGDVGDRAVALRRVVTSTRSSGGGAGPGPSSTTWSSR